MSSHPATATTRVPDRIEVEPMANVRHQAAHHGPAEAPPEPVMEAHELNVYYGDFHAVHDVNLAFGRHEITALIGPSGCG